MRTRREKEEEAGTGSRGIRESFLAKEEYGKEHSGMKE